MNRKINKIPRIKYAGLFPLPDFQVFQLPNGTQVYYIQDEKINTCRVEWIFAAGRSYESVTSQSELTTAMLRESNRQYSGYKNAEFFDQFGSSFYIYNGLDNVVAGYACLNTWTKKLFDRALLSLREPAWKATDLKLIQKLKQENLQESIADIDILSYRALTEKIFGRQHPYGYNTTINTIANIHMDALQDHWERNYFNESMFVIISGNVYAQDLDYMLNKLGNISLSQKVKMTSKIKANTPFVPDPIVWGKNQKSIKLGCKMIKREHPDFTAVFMTSMLLGGYFNSRLNKTIRERKGLTYHISSQIDLARLAGIFYISSDTSVQYADRVITAIFHELKKIAAIPPSTGELNMLKSYLLGNMLHQYEGAFATADTLRHTIIEGAQYQDNSKMMNQIKNMEANTISDVATKYFVPEKMLISITG